MKTNTETLLEAYSSIPLYTKEVIDRHLLEIKSEQTLDEGQLDRLYHITLKAYKKAVLVIFDRLLQIPNITLAYGAKEPVYRDIGKMTNYIVDCEIKKTPLETLKDKPFNKKEREEQRHFKGIVLIFSAYLGGKKSYNEANVLMRDLDNHTDETIVSILERIVNGTHTERPLLVGGKGCEEISQAFAQSIRDKGIDLESGLSKFNQLNKKTSATQRKVDDTVEVTIKIKNTQSKTVSALSYPSKVSPTSKHSMRLLMWVWNKLTEGYCVKSKTLKRIGFHIADIVGEGKVFADKRQAVEAFKEVREFFKRFEWVSVYSATSKKGKEAQISTFGKVKKDRLAILPKRVFNVGHFNDVSKDEAFFIEGIEDEDINYETFMHKVMTAPRAFLVLYSHIEQEIVYNLLNEWDKGGTPKNNFKTITHEKILDWVGFALNNPTRPRRIIDEIVKAIKSINERDKGETFSRLEIKFDDTVKQPQKRLKTMRIFYSVNRCEECLEIEQKKGVDDEVKTDQK